MCELLKVYSPSTNTTRDTATRTLARISCWPPEDFSICDPKHVGVNFTWTFNVFLINIELWVHELVIIETGHIDARFKYDVYHKEFINGYNG